MHKYVVVTESGLIDIVSADSVAEACDEYDWKYPGTVISVTRLPGEGGE